MIYLDYAATSPMSELALNSYIEVARRYYGNSASLHDCGGQAAYYVEQARRVVASKLQVAKDGIIFTGSGTEGNILAILSLALASKRGKHIITTQAEHTSVHAALNTLEKAGYEVTKLTLLPNGEVNLHQLEAVIRPDTALVSIQHVNSEIGVIQPIEQITQLVKQAGIYIHVDCVQSFCKLPIESFSTAVDAITVSAHKIGGPKGCGAIYLNPQIIVSPLIPGVTHERGLRGGTVDTPAIVAFATAVESYVYDETYSMDLRQLLLRNLPDSYEIVECTNQLPTICSLLTKKYDGQYVLLKLNERGICISTGSACDVQHDAGTKAVIAMGYSVNDARKVFRVSFGQQTTINEVQQLIFALKDIG